MSQRESRRALYRREVHTRAPILPHAARMLDLISDEVLVACFAPLSAVDLCALSSTARRYRRAASADVLWRKLLLNAFVLPPGLAATAARLAGSFRALYQEEHVAGKRASPWRVPSRHTLDAFVQRGTAASDAALSPSTPGAVPLAPLAILFLVDGRRVTGAAARAGRLISAACKPLASR